MNQEKKLAAELEALQQIQRTEHFQNLRAIIVHQTGEPPYYVWQGVGNFDGIDVSETPDYTDTTPDELSFPMLPRQFEQQLLPLLQSLGIGVLVWGGDVENIPSEHILSIADVRTWFANEGGGRRLAG